MRTSTMIRTAVLAVTALTCAACGQSAPAGPRVFFVQPADANWWTSSAQLTRLGVFVLENVAIVAMAWARERKAKRAAETQQLRAVHVTAHTMQDIVANSLNQLQLLRMDAEGLVPQESVDYVISRSPFK